MLGPWSRQIGSGQLGDGMSVDILGTSELKWTGRAEFNSDDHFLRQESLRKNGVAILVNERVWDAVLEWNVKNDGVISVHFQGIPFNITVIHGYSLANNAEEAEVDWFYEYQQDLKLTPKKDSFSLCSSGQSLSHVRLFATPWIAAHQASLYITNSRSSLKLTSIESVMPSSHLILCRPLLLLPPIPPTQSLFQWVNSSHEVAKVLEFQL